MSIASGFRIHNRRGSIILENYTRVLAIHTQRVLVHAHSVDMKTENCHRAIEPRCLPYTSMKLKKYSRKTKPCRSTKQARPLEQTKLTQNTVSLHKFTLWTDIWTSSLALEEVGAVVTIDTKVKYSHDHRK